MTRTSSLAHRIRQRFIKLAQAAHKRKPRFTHPDLSPNDMSWELQGVNLDRDFPPILRVILRHRGIDIAYALAETLPKHIFPSRKYAYYYKGEIIDAYHAFSLVFVEHGHLEYAQKLQAYSPQTEHWRADWSEALIQAREYDKAFWVSSTIPLSKSYGYTGNVNLEDWVFPRYIKIAKARLKAGDVRGARRVFNRFKTKIHQDPEHANFFRFFLAHAYYRLGWIKQSAQLLDDILTHFSSSMGWKFTGPTQFCSMAYAIARAGYRSLGLRMMQVAYDAYQSEIVMVAYHLPRYLFLLNRFNMHEEAQSVLSQMLIMKENASNPAERLEWICLIGTGVALNPHYQHVYDAMMDEIPTAMSVLHEGWFPKEFVIRSLLDVRLRRGEIEPIIAMLGQMYWQMFDVAFFLPDLLTRLRVLGQSELGRTLLKEAHAGLKEAENPEWCMGFGLIEPALKAGFIEEAIAFFKDIKSHYWSADVFRDISQVLLRENRWKQFLSLRYLGTIHDLISIAAQLAPELDAIQHGLAFEVLSNCIHAAAQTHPEWRLVSERIGTIPES